MDCHVVRYETRGETDVAAIALGSDGRVELEVSGRESAFMDVAVLRALCAVLGPAVLAAASRIERLPARED